MLQFNSAAKESKTVDPVLVVSEFFVVLLVSVSDIGHSFTGAWVFGPVCTGLPTG